MLPEAYPIPHDGPVGDLLKGAGRHPWRPAHIHFQISAPGYKTCTTHVFVDGDQYLDSDAVFGVKSSLIQGFEHTPGRRDPRRPRHRRRRVLDDALRLRARRGGQGVSVLETDVLIVGSGPAGGASALFLSTLGVDNVCITKYRWTANTPRAHITNQRTMEILRDAGVEGTSWRRPSPTS